MTPNWWINWNGAYRGTAEEAEGFAGHVAEMIERAGIESVGSQIEPLGETLGERIERERRWRASDARFLGAIGRDDVKESRTESEMTLSPEHTRRLEQAQLLRERQTRALWLHLSDDQREAVLDPSARVGDHFPLTSKQIAKLSTLDESQIRGYADGGLIPFWRNANRRQFEAVGLIWAFALANANANVQAAD